MTENANGGAAGTPAASDPAGGAAATPWFSQEQADYVTNKGWKSPTEVVSSAMNLEKLLGADRAGRTIVMPKDEKDADGIKAFRAKLGVPESPDGYQLPIPDGMDPTLAKAAAGWFHEEGIPSAAAAKFTEKWNGYIGKLVEQQEREEQAKSAQELESLRGEWGPNFEKNSEFARRFLKASGLEEADVTALEKSLGTAKMLKTFQGWGSKIAEHSFAGGDTGSGNPSGKAAVNAQMSELRTKRMANQITEAEYFSEMERLGKLSELAA